MADVLELFNSAVMLRAADLSEDAHGVLLATGRQPRWESSSTPDRGNITLEIVENLETDLDFHETVSVMFLVCDSVDVTLQNLIIAYKTVKGGSMQPLRLLSNWARSTEMASWRDKLVDALCMVQNFQVLGTLGYNLEDMQVRGREAYLEVDHLRKALYTVCEDLPSDKASQLIRLATSDQPDLETHDAEYLELNLLQWHSQHYVTLVGETLHVAKLTRLLKILGEYELGECLEEALRRYRHYDTDQASANPASTSHSVLSTYSGNSTILPRSDCYNINPGSVGKCIIVNQKIFTQEPDPHLQGLLAPSELETRIGTDVDRDRLYEMFRNFGFDVEVQEDLTHNALLDNIRQAALEVRPHHSCFAVCILSHGRRNEVYGSNSIPVSMESIHKQFMGKGYPNLLGKPKIMIVQACQGGPLQRAISVPGIASDLAEDGPRNQFCPELCDLLTFWSTVPGYASIRDEIRGSWFIEALWHELLNRPPDMNVVQAFTRVNYRVMFKHGWKQNELRAMMPIFNSTLGRELVLPCDPGVRSAIAVHMVQRYLFSTLLHEYVHSRVLRSLRSRISDH